MAEMGSEGVVASTTTSSIIENFQKKTGNTTEFSVINNGTGNVSTNTNPNTSHVISSAGGGGTIYDAPETTNLNRLQTPINGRTLTTSMGRQLNTRSSASSRVKETSSTSQQVFIFISFRPSFAKLVNRTD